MAVVDESGARLQDPTRALAGWEPRRLLGGAMFAIGDLSERLRA